MKESKNRILLISVLVIWSLISYQIYTRLLSRPSVRSDVISNAKEEPEKQITYELNLNYTDPFLKASSHANKELPAPVVQKEPQPVVEEKKVEWATIIFYGILKNNTSANTIASFVCNGREYFVKEDEVVGDIQVYDITPDSLGLLCQEELKYFPRRSEKAL